jgi:hypothetical protein
MSSANREIRVALLAVAAASAIAGAASRSEAQHPRAAVAAPPQPMRVRQPAPAGPIGVAGQAQRLARVGQPGLRHLRHGRHSTRIVLPPAYYYPAYPAGGYPSIVYDVNGRPLSEFFDEPQPSQNAYPPGIPDLSGSPYLVLDDGAMVVDLGNGDMRTVPSCAALSATRTPDGKSRTIFYTPPAGGVLRAGTRGRVLGMPPDGAHVCYAWDAYGRAVLSY